MRLKFCFFFVVFYLTAIFLFTIYLRSTNDRIFYKLCTLNAEQNRLKQQLGNKQLRLESLINPASVSEQMGE